MLEALKKQLEETNEKLIKAEEQCASLEEERIALEEQLEEANKRLEIYNTGKEIGSVFMAMVEGMKDSGMPKELAMDMANFMTRRAIAGMLPCSIF